MASPLASVRVAPGRQLFPDLDAVRTAFPAIRIPSQLPPAARLVVADWQYPPIVTWRERGGKAEATSIDYDVKPALQRGHVQLVFAVAGGGLTIDQGQFAFLNPATHQQLGPVTPIRLANGRDVLGYEVRGERIPYGALRVIGWYHEHTGYQFSALSNVLSLEQLTAIVNRA